MVVSGYALDRNANEGVNHQAAVLLRDAGRQRADLISTLHRIARHAPTARASACQVRAIEQHLISDSTAAVRSLRVSLSQSS